MLLLLLLLLLPTIRTTIHDGLHPHRQSGDETTSHSHNHSHNHNDSHHPLQSKSSSSSSLSRVGALSESYQKHLAADPCVPIHYLAAAALAAGVGVGGNHHHHQFFNFPASTAAYLLQKAESAEETEEKRAKRLERNRESARKSRRRKKERLKHLEEKVHGLFREAETFRRKGNQILAATRLTAGLKEAVLYQLYLSSFRTRKTYVDILTPAQSIRYKEWLLTNSNRDRVAALLRKRRKPWSSSSSSSTQPNRVGSAVVSSLGTTSTTWGTTEHESNLEMLCHSLEESLKVSKNLPTTESSS
eukprot:jgi/Psemu1/288692/fgenesh1_pg.285_\